MPLSDIAIRNAKPGAKIRKLSDGGGLQVWIMPNGSKLWRLAYRIHGKQKLLAVGPYPAHSLAAARAVRDNAKGLMARGVDPSDQKRADKLSTAEARGNTFEVIAAELLEKKRREGKAKTTLEKVEWLKGIACAEIGKRPIAEITASEVLLILKRVEARGRLETAKRLRSVIGEVFRYAIATARADNDPTFALRGALSAPQVRHRAAITDPRALGALLRAIDGFHGQPTTVAALKLMAYLFPRPGELRQAEWREFDLDRAIWEIPANRTKMRRPHRVPLPEQALAILRELQTVTGRSALAFPGHGMSGGEGRRVAPRPISENTMNSALRRMGYSTEEMTPHGFRASASTLLNESGKFSADCVERALAHQDADAVRRAYARGEHWQERLTMAQWWADHLDSLRDGAKIIVADFGAA